MKKLIFLGTNSVLERHIDACNRQNQPIGGIIDSDWFGNQNDFAGLPILDSETIFQSEPDKYTGYVFFIGVNWNPTYYRDFLKRQMLIDIVTTYRLDCINLIDPTSYISPYAKLGKGVMIGAHTVVNPRVTIDDFVSVWDQAHIAHDTAIGKNVVIQRSAYVHAKSIGQDSYIGIGSRILRDGQVSIGNNVIIAPGLQILHDVADFEKVTTKQSSSEPHRVKNSLNNE